MSKTYFIADLHLDKNTPEITALFERFLVFLGKEKQKGQVDALYILGDFFELWAGDDIKSSLSKHIAALLSACDFPVYFLHGNRDFLMGDDYLASANMTALDEEAVISLYKKNCLVMHGDTLCTNDIKYQAYRKKTRDPCWQAKALEKPKLLRYLIAKYIRIRSKLSHSNQYQNPSLTGVDELACKAKLAQYQADMIIHGHIHQPGVHAIKTTDHTQYPRFVVSDWHEDAVIVVASESGVHLVRVSELLN